MLTDESSLPRHVLVDTVLAYLDTRALIRFSRTSKACRDVVHRDLSRTRWRTVDLSGNRRIDDDQLRALLTNIDARSNAVSLSLVGCTNVNGSGLEPLRGSVVMEDIDLRVLGSLPLSGEMGRMRGPSGLREDVVADVLRSMLPPSSATGDDAGRPRPHTHTVALRRIAIRPRSLTPPRDGLGRCANYGTEIGRVLRHHDSLLGRSHSAPTDRACSLCGVSSGDVFDCDSSSCDGRRFCIPCALPETCPECIGRRCQWCNTSVACASCGVRSCASHGYEGCGTCETVYCRDCHVDALDFSISRNEYYCAGCEPPYWGGNIR